MLAINFNGLSDFPSFTQPRRRRRFESSTGMINVDPNSPSRRRRLIKVASDRRSECYYALTQITFVTVDRGVKNPRSLVTAVSALIKSRSDGLFPVPSATSNATDNLLSSGPRFMRS